MTTTEADFHRRLNDLLLEIRKKAESQFAYNLGTNIPNKIGGITLDNAAEHAINQGFSSAFNAVNGWDVNKAIRIAYDVMEDANAHEECRALAKFIPEYA